MNSSPQSTQGEERRHSVTDRCLDHHEMQEKVAETTQIIMCHLRFMSLYYRIAGKHNCQCWFSSLMCSSVLLLSMNLRKNCHEINHR